MVDNQFYKKVYLYKSNVILKTRTQERSKKKEKPNRKQTKKNLRKKENSVPLLTSMLNYCLDAQSTVGSLCPVWVYQDLSWVSF